MAIAEYDYSLDEPVSIIGDFTTGETVTIELWVDGVAQVVTSSDCTEVDGTGKYVWSISNIPALNGSRVQYHFRMTDSMSNTVEGDFILTSSEGSDGFMPSILDPDSYILRI